MFGDDTLLTTLVRIAGLLQLSVLIASALVPQQLDWRGILKPLPKLVQQLFWTYGGYVVGMIIFNSLLALLFAHELTSGSALGRFLCGYIALFWGVRLCLQLWFDARPFLTAWWLVAGEVVLTLLFVMFTSLFAYVALMA
jgi:hypothetical protein